LLDRCRGRYSAEARAVGQPTLLWVSAYAQSWHETLDGNLDGAEARALEALELGTATGQPDVLPIYGAQLLVMRWHQGRDAEVVGIIEQMVEATPDIDSFRSALARIYADLGRSAEARRLLSAEAEKGFPHPVDPLLATTMVLWAEAAIQADHGGAAEVLLDRMAPLPAQIVCNGVTVLGALDHYRGALCGLLGRLSEAEQCLSRALEAHVGIRAPFLEARSCLELAKVVKAGGRGEDRHGADDLCRRALVLAERHDFPTVGARAAALLAR
jgi:hypothetical protein